MLKPNQKDTLHSKTKRKLQQDGREGHNQDKIKSNTCQVGNPTNWEILIPQNSPIRSDPHQASQPEGLAIRRKPSENLALKASGVWSEEFHKTGGNWNSTVGGGRCTQIPYIPGPKGKVVTSQDTGPDLPVVFNSLLQRCRDKTLAVAVLASIHWHKHSWRSPFSPQDLAQPIRL